MNADPMIPQPLEVLRRGRETKDTFTVYLRATEGGFSFRPGQFNMLYAFGIGEVPISMSGDPRRTKEIVHTVRSVGPVTRSICGLNPGDNIGVRGPFGTEWPIERLRGHDVLVIAGGIGLAPLRSAIYAILADRDAFRRVAIVYGSRTPDDLLYHAELEEWRGRPDLQVLLTVDRADDRWRGDVGVVTDLLDRVELEPARTAALICGPEIMMRFSIRALERSGVSPEAIHLSMERNMKCAVGHCGHCQYGPHFVCKDGAVFALPQVADLLGVREI